MMRPDNQRHAGFTLVEVITAALILAVGVVVVCGVSKRCIEGAARGRRYETAYRLLDECLDRTVAASAATLAGQERIAGAWGEEHPGYEFTIQIIPTEQTDLYQVAAEVIWHEQQERFAVTAETLVYDPAPIEDVEAALRMLTE